MPNGNKISGSRPGGISGSLAEQSPESARKSSGPGQLQQYSLSHRQSSMSPKALARKFLPSLGGGRVNGSWMRVRADVLKSNPEMKAAESLLRRADRQNDTHELSKLWREVAKDFSQQLPETLRLMSDGKNARLLPGRSSDIARDVLANILRQRLPSDSGNRATVPKSDSPKQPHDLGKPRLQNRPRRPPPRERPPPVPRKDAPIRGKSGSERSRPRLERELRQKQERLDGLLEQRAQLQQRVNDAQQAMGAPFRKLHETTRKRAQAFLPGGRYSRSVLKKAKVPASMHKSSEFAGAFRKRLTERLDERFELAPMAGPVTQQKLHTIAVLAARAAAKDVQAARDLAALDEI